MMKHEQQTSRSEKSLFFRVNNFSGLYLCAVYAAIRLPEPGELEIRNIELVQQQD